MIIHYTYTNFYPLALYYSLRDPRHLWVNMNMKGYLTPEIIRAHLYHLMDKEPPKGLIEAILNYPEVTEDRKDVTVVF